MLKEKKKQIIKAEKMALEHEMKSSPGKPAAPAPKIVTDLDQKKRIAEAVKAVIKSKERTNYFFRTKSLSILTMQIST